MTNESTYETPRSRSVASRSALTCSGRWLEFQSLACGQIMINNPVKKTPTLRLLPKTRSAHLNEHFLPLDDSFVKELLQRLPDLVLVVIVVGAVDHPVTGPDGAEHRRAGAVGGGLPRAEAYPRHARACPQDRGLAYYRHGYRCCCCCSFLKSRRCRFETCGNTPTRARTVLLDSQTIAIVIVLSEPQQFGWTVCTAQGERLASAR